MRASSPALALVTRPRLSVPRPSPKAASPGSEPPPASTPRPTLRSVDLEPVADDASVESPTRVSSIPPPLPDRARRPSRAPQVSRPEIAETVFVGLRDLSFFETPVEAVSFGLITALKALPSMAGLALLRDDDHGGFAVVYARGPRSHRVVRTRVADDDAFVGLALVRGGPVAIEYGSECAAPERHALFGEPWSALFAPILVGEKCLGVLELVDPLDGRAALATTARHALATIVQHLAVSLGGRALCVEQAYAPEQVGLGEEA